MLYKAIVRGLLMATVAASAVTAQAVTIDMVPVANSGNVGEGSGESYGGYGPDRMCGAVNYDYQIGKYEITAGQYIEFLNAKAKSDPYGLYSIYMDTANSVYGCNIEQNGSDGSYTYSVASDWANRPVNRVSFWDATRFCNWLHNGQGNGDTETGAYTLNGYNDNDGREIARNPGAKWFLPSEDEWYKAAYYDPNKQGGAGYYNYPTKSDTAPSNVGSDGYDDPGNHANYNSNDDYTIGSPYWRTTVGEFESSASAYGTFDQGGNVWEWNEAVVYEWETDSVRGLRGGSFSYDLSYLLASNRERYSTPTYRYSRIGFRVASVVPEPGSIAIVIAGAISLLIYARLHRKQTA